jgi:peptidoglycan/xylan/chitin deacetylase (PgdA/CDA1 family)
MRERIAWKRRIGQLYAFMRARDAQRKLILVYHSVGDSTEATAKDAFRDQLGVIAAMGQFLPLQELLGSTPNQSIAVAVTFDDGYATLRDHAATILTEFGGAATVFLNVGEIADDERRASRAADGYYPHEQFLAWRDVDALIAAGWHVGSHGVHHLDLVHADTAASRHEVTASKQMIERRLRMPCDLFAYPWGRNGPELRAQVRAAGYRYGFAGDHSPLTATSDPFALPRINVANGYSRDDLAAILRGDWDYLYWLARAKAALG